ncbi:hypothetical protein ACR8AL_11890 [Clavibacter sepedonicus]|uniref:Uncharacterized protein n=1 Tax=Clavibacter sepedonicus TaxID=31964 RepID=B0RD35_CLASE|nr:MULTISPECIES: hypothetical protein [Clavibacter]MBD5383141.1 hypothetical protein [Clavibacter sp.]OQJ49033.1 hypothetical protein B5P19_12880 [Clavibacter sepedonicus]OQJ53660.1 hypothetical protein B5P20_05570 [Clavibacter sepedonicus]UUK65220.1 hypothetical protein LRE50_13200 [Clavibacter sepedonicus]CAQ00634.1 hypothetical protein CMS0515 [Clavibacter sepedonicus]
MNKKQTIIRDGIAAIISRLDPDIHRDLEGDRDAYLRLVATVADIDAEAHDTLRDAVHSARAAGASWERIGDTLRISRQAAQQRFGQEARPVGTRGRRLSPVTAFTEMERLEEAGRHGWHSVAFGTLYHDLVQDDQQWEYRRVSVFSSRHALEAEGWERIGSMWIPWAYYARPTGEPPLPEPAEASVGIEPAA